MNRNNIYLPLLLILLTAVLPSCLKDQEDIFDKSSSVRMQEYLDNAKKVLMDAPNGWAFDYAPDRNMSYGMILYSLQFTDKDVTVGTEIAPGEYETSLYKLTPDNGPCLSFDSYNTLMHYYATPSWEHYQGLDGDFEFIIMDVKPEKITLKGKRTGNYMYLTRLNEDPTSFISKSMASAEEQWMVRARGTVAGKNASVFLNLDVNYMEMTFEDADMQPVGRYFAFSPEGIRFPNPLEVNGSVIDGLNFTFDDTQNIGHYTALASSQVDVKLDTYIPDDYAFIEDFSGAFTFDYNDTSVDCTLVPDIDNGTVLIKGLNANYDIVTTYSRGFGSLSLTSQLIYTVDDEHVFRFCAGTLGGFFSAPNMAGIQFKRDEVNPNKFVAEVSNLPKAKEAGKFFCVVEFIGPDAYWPNDRYKINKDSEFEIKSLTKK